MAVNTETGWENMETLKQDFSLLFSLSAKYISPIRAFGREMYAGQLSDTIWAGNRHFPGSAAGTVWAAGTVGPRFGPSYIVRQQRKGTIALSVSLHALGIKPWFVGPALKQNSPAALYFK